jgi:hypothetical protein
VREVLIGITVAVISLILEKSYEHVRDARRNRARGEAGKTEAPAISDEGLKSAD